MRPQVGAPNTVNWVQITNGLKIHPVTTKMMHFFLPIWKSKAMVESALPLRFSLCWKFQQPLCNHHKRQQKHILRSFETHHPKVFSLCTQNVGFCPGMCAPRRNLDGQKGKHLISVTQRLFARNPLVVNYSQKNKPENTLTTLTPKSCINVSTWSATILVAQVVSVVFKQLA